MQGSQSQSQAMSWAQSLFNSRSNSTVRASGNVFTPSTAVVNGSSNHHRNGTNNQMNRSSSNIRTGSSSNPAIPTLNATQLRNIELPELPKDLLNLTPSTNHSSAINALNARNGVNSVKAVPSNRNNMASSNMKPIRYKVPRFHKASSSNTNPNPSANTNHAVNHSANGVNGVNALNLLNGVNGLKSLNASLLSGVSANTSNSNQLRLNQSNPSMNGQSTNVQTQQISNLLDNFILNGSSAMNGSLSTNPSSMNRNNNNNVNNPNLNGLKSLNVNDLNQLLSNGSGATININNVNNINNINHLNINQSGNIHNAVSTLLSNGNARGQQHSVNVSNVSSNRNRNQIQIQNGNHHHIRYQNQNQNVRSSASQNDRRLKAQALFQHIMGSAIPSNQRKRPQPPQRQQQSQQQQQSMQSLQRIQGIQRMKGRNGLNPLQSQQSQQSLHSMNGIKSNGMHSNGTNLQNVNAQQLQSQSSSHWVHSKPPLPPPSGRNAQKRIKLKLRRPRFPKMGNMVHSNNAINTKPTNAMPPTLPIPQQLIPSITTINEDANNMSNMDLPPAVDPLPTNKPSIIPSPIHSIHPLGAAQPALNKNDNDLIGSILNGSSDHKVSDASASTDTDCSNQNIKVNDNVNIGDIDIVSDELDVPIISNSKMVKTHSDLKLKVHRTETLPVEGEPKDCRESGDSTTNTPFDDELLVDVNGVKWDDTVNWVCGVCEGADAQTQNALVVCEGCSRAVHQNCYHVPPAQLEGDGDWYCQPCTFKRSILQNESLVNRLRAIYKEYIITKGGNHHTLKSSLPLTIAKLLHFAESRHQHQSPPNTNPLSPPSTTTPSVPHSVSKGTDDLGNDSLGGFMVSAAEKTRSQRRRKQINQCPSSDYSNPNLKVKSVTNGGTPGGDGGDPMHSAHLPLNVLTDFTTNSDTFFNGKTLPKCALCNTIGGSYKLSADGSWVHVSCSTFHPEVTFLDPIHWNHPVLTNISRASLTAKCSLCHQSGGACIQCTFKPHCNKWFHVTCAQSHRLYLLRDDTKDAVESGHSLTAFCPEHTRNFKLNASAAANRTCSRSNRGRNRSRNRVSGRKRKRNEGDSDYKPRSQKPKRSRSSRRSKNKLNGNSKSSRGGKRGKPEVPTFSPDPPLLDLEYIERTTDEYIQRLLKGEDGGTGTTSTNSGDGVKSDDISSVSSQEGGGGSSGNGNGGGTRDRTVAPPPKLKKRRKSAVDMLSHSSFAPKRNKWVFNQIFHLYPPREEFLESKDHEEDVGDEGNGFKPDPNHWTLETTTDPTQVVAEACMRSVETLWTHRQTNLLAKSQNGRDYRKSLGFSILRNPNRDVITSCNWALWEVSATKMAVLIKLFITEPYSKSKIPQRRKKNGTLLAAHVMDIAFRSRDDVDFVVICSERGIAEIFWRALGFTDFTSQEKRSFCRGTEKDLNQFRDTILLRMHHDDYIEKYCDGATEWGEDNCAVEKVFRKWRKKHLHMTRRLVFKLKGRSVHTHVMPSY